MENGNIKIGDVVTFRDEFGERRTGKVIRIIPMGHEASAPSVAIDAGGYGFYNRQVREVEKRDTATEQTN